MQRSQTLQVGLEVQNTPGKRPGTERQAELRSAKRPHVAVEVVIANTNRSSTWSTTKRDNSNIICLGWFSHLQPMVIELSDCKQTSGSVKVYWHKLGHGQAGTHRSYSHHESGLLGKGV